MACYLDMFNGYPNFIIARSLCDKYTEYPVVAWRNLFIEVANQLAEYDGDVVEEQLKDNEFSKNLKNAKTEPHMHCDLDKNTVLVYHQNITEVEVRYYIVDLEILFSRSPFLAETQNQFMFVKPNFQ